MGAPNPLYGWRVGLSTWLKPNIYIKYKQLTFHGSSHEYIKYISIRLLLHNPYVLNVCIYIYPTSLDTTHKQLLKSSTLLVCKKQDGITHQTMWPHYWVVHNFGICLLSKSRDTLSQLRCMSLIFLSSYVHKSDNN